MASAILGGLLDAGYPRAHLRVVEPHPPQAQLLRSKFSIDVDTTIGSALVDAQIVIWAVKPQVFREAATGCSPFVGEALHLSVMAGISTGAIAQATGSERVVRAMPNMPALIGEGISGLFARESVTPQDREVVQALLAFTGETLYVSREIDLDAVTALSGSGPGYVFFFLEAMVQAATDMDLPPEQALQLALATFKGATALARTSNDGPAALRAQVTSRGGTTQAGISAMEAHGVRSGILAGMRAAQARARELGAEFGGNPA